MTPRKNGVFQAAVALGTAGSYRFHYLHNDERWKNCWATTTSPTNYGTDDSVVTTW